MEKINIAELLKDCPQGMELDCILFDNDVKVIFDGVDGINTCASIIKIVVIHDNNRIYHTLTKYGQWNPYKYAKCIIFPKGKTTWEDFVPPHEFKDGDIIAYDSNVGTTIFIHRNKNDEHTYKTSFYVGLNVIDDSFVIYNKYTLTALCDDCDTRLATEEEKAKLFDVIKANGYKWNAETKTLEKLVEPKFKVGDIVRNKNYKDYIYTIHDIVDKGYSAKVIDADYPIIILFGSQEDNYELVPNKFDITTLKPFESKVLVRNWNSDYWKPAIFGFTEKNKNAPFYVEGGNFFNKCIPYEGNEHLLGTTIDCDEYYKTW